MPTPTDDDALDAEATERAIALLDGCSRATKRAFVDELAHQLGLRVYPLPVCTPTAHAPVLLRGVATCQCGAL